MSVFSIRPAGTPAAADVCNSIEQSKTVSALTKILNDLAGRYDDRGILENRFEIHAAITSAFSRLRLTPLPPAPQSGRLGPRSLSGLKESNRIADELMDSTRQMLAHAGAVCRGGFELQGQQSESWYSLAQAARLTSVNQGTLHREIKKGKIKSNGQSGKGKVKVCPMSLMNWVENRSDDRSDERIETDSAVERKFDKLNKK